MHQPEPAAQTILNKLQGLSRLGGIQTVRDLIHIQNQVVAQCFLSDLDSAPFIPRPGGHAGTALGLFSNIRWPALAERNKSKNTVHRLHRTAKGSALDVGYANPQLDARIQKGSAR